ncbi:hypothetical protein A2483_03820 [Candidatus Peregrinibacteria bacterium RIFOXYC2_FULL_33_13]|nr:MAG: Ribosome-binding factor A [Candidatus Peregrinibacteria bacterium GW2011_GWA2_33_10]KKP41168.1 MAG: ribosome-binding factor A, ribosome-binding factor A [Candidatus Peregrinibacteria bacterium GW2011_GWC2_33_13]OGJ53843.1 MAG: hypothetical protein A2483_03820 [Candidatus Peregrinibacteria bacterium RIFOXYC2_FULL_33_13]
MKNRKLILNSIIKDEVSRIIQEKIEIKEFGLITVTRAVTAKNLDSCRVYVRSLIKQENLLNVLNKRIYHIQKELNPRLRLHKVPKIIFQLDENLEYVDNIEKILERI